MLNVKCVFVLIDSDQFCHHKNFGLVIFDLGATFRVEDVFQNEVRDAEGLTDAGELTHVVESREMEPGHLVVVATDSFGWEGVECCDVTEGLIVPSEMNVGILGAPLSAVNEGTRRLGERAPFPEGNGDGGRDGAGRFHGQYRIIARGCSLSVPRFQKYRKRTGEVTGKNGRAR